MQHGNTGCWKAAAATLTWYKLDFRIRTIARDKEEFPNARVASLLKDMNHLS